MIQTLQHLNASGCEIDHQSFGSYYEMESYIDICIMSVWEEGDRLICNGTQREVFTDLPAQYLGRC